MMARPRFAPDSQQRQRVKLMAAMGAPHDQIVKVIGIRSSKTLRRHFRHELDCGTAEANIQVAQTLYKMATSGNNLPATKLWLANRAGWVERPWFEPSSTVAPPFIVALEKGNPLP
jgi:hypothetical protein